MADKEIREYYILAGIPGMKEKIIESDLELSPVYFMTVQEDTDLGKRIKKEAQRKLDDVNVATGEGDKNGS